MILVIYWRIYFFIKSNHYNEIPDPIIIRPNIWTILARTIRSNKWAVKIFDLRQRVMCSKALCYYSLRWFYLAQVVFLLASPKLAGAISRHHKKDIPKVKTNFIKIDECNKNEIRSFRYTLHAREYKTFSYALEWLFKLSHQMWKCLALTHKSFNHDRAKDFNVWNSNSKGL